MKRDLSYREETPKGFNLQVHYRDEKTGLVEKEDPYILRVVSDGSANGKSQLWERPKGSGNIYNKQMEPIGRWVDGKFVEGAEHVAWVPPLTNDQKLAKSLTEKDAQIAALEKENAAIKAEAAKRNPAPAAKKEQGS